MALVIANRVKETTTTAGTGTVTLLGASAGFQSFAVVGNANTTYYTIAAQVGTEWEVGIGTYTSSGTTLARTTVLANSAGTQPTALTFSAGIKDVFVTYPAGYSVSSTNNPGTAGQVLASNGVGVDPTWVAAPGPQAGGVIYENSLVISSNYTLTAGKNAMSVGPITINSGVAVTVPSGQRWLVF
jgi:hypothetical protein